MGVAKREELAAETSSIVHLMEKAVREGEREVGRIRVRRESEREGEPEGERCARESE